MTPLSPSPQADFDLRGTRAFVTGSQGGIGRSVVAHLQALGAQVYGTDLGPAGAAEAGMDGYRAADLTDPAALDDLCAWITELGPDVFVNNAALFDLGSVLDADLDQFDRLFSVNVRAFYALMQAAAKAMIANREADPARTGSIINFSSQAGHRGEALVAHYCATKAAVISYTQSAALALAPHAVRVNAISPGVVDTPMWKQVDALFADAEGLQIGEKKRQVGEAVPLGRMGDPIDVARVVCFLASDLSTYMTAQTIGVDGGNVLR